MSSAPQKSGGMFVAIISASIMLSRLLGLIREQLFAALLGASQFSDAFIVAFRIPNLLRDLFAEGALAQAFVPTFKDRLNRDGPESAYDLGNRTAGTLAAVISFLLAGAFIGAPLIVTVLAADYSGEKFELTVLLTRIMLPFLLMVSLAAVAMGMLNAQDKYAAPALAPATFNVVSIAVAVGLYFAGADGRTVAIGWAIGAVAGGIAQLAVQLPSLWKLGFRPRLRIDLRLRDPGIRRIATLMLPALAGVAAVQINIFVNTMFATTEAGAVTWLNFAFRLLQLPIGVFGVAIATVATTRFADAASRRDAPQMARRLQESLRLALFLAVPASVGLWLLSGPIITIIFEHGKFDQLDTYATAAALRWYVLGLVAYACVKVIAPAFYAAKLARLAVIASISAVAVNLAINITLHPVYGYRALAFGTAVSAIINFGLLLFFFVRRIANMPLRTLATYATRVGLAATVMGCAVWGSHRVLAELCGPENLANELVVALVPIAVGGLTYAASCHLLRIEEALIVSRKLRQKLRRS